MLDGSALLTQLISNRQYVALVKCFSESQKEENSWLIQGWESLDDGLENSIADLPASGVSHLYASALAHQLPAILPSEKQWLTARARGLIVPPTKPKDDAGVVSPALHRELCRDFHIAGRLAAPGSFQHDVLRGEIQYQFKGKMVARGFDHNGQLRRYAISDMHRNSRNVFRLVFRRDR